MSAIINPGGSGGGIAVTLSSNTTGTLALVSSGTLTLAGGNNITLSQAGNAITISGAAAGGAQTAISGVAASNTTYTSGTVSFTGVGGGVTVSSNTGQRIDISVATPVPIGTSINPVASASSVGTVTRYAAEDHRHQGVGTLGVSGGNVVGDTGTTLGQVMFAGGNNITLSQVTAAGGLATITISAANETQTVPPIGTSINPVATAGSTGTITRFAAEDHRHAGLVSLGISGGNTAGNSSGGTLGSVLLAGGNKITLSQVSGAGGATITISAANETNTGNLGAIAAGTQTATSGTVVFSNSNNVTFGMSGSSQMTASASYSSEPFNQIAAGTQTAPGGSTVVLSNSNGISFGMSNSSVVTASYTVPTVTNSSWTVSDAATSGTVARLAFTNLNGVTLSLSSGAGGSHTIVGSHNALTSQSNQAFSAAGGSSAFQTLSFADTNSVSFTNTGGSIGVASVKLQLFAVSNTTQSSSGTANHTALSFGGAGVASVGVTGGSVVISVPAGGGTPFGVSAGTQSVSTGTVVFSNSNNVTFGMSGSSQVTASASYSSEPFNQIAAGTQTAPGGSTVLFSNSNGISFGMSNSSVVTASYTVPTETPFGVSAGTQSVSTGTLVFSNSNNVTFGMSGSSRVTASASYSSEPFNQIAAGTQTAPGGSTVVFSNSNGISFGMSNSSIVTASYTVPTVTNSSWSVSDAATSGTVARLAFTNLNGVTLSLSSGAGGSHTIVGSHNALTSQSNQAVSAAGGSSAFQTLNFADTNSVFFTNTGGSVGVASVKLQMFAVSNTTQSSSGTANHTALSFGGAGIASVGVTGGSVVISVPSGGGAAVASTGLQDIGTATASGTNTSQFAAGDHIHRGVKALQASGTNSSFFGDVTIGTGNLIALSTGGGTTAGSINIHNLLSSATTVSFVESTNVVGAMASRFALEGHQHAGVPAFAAGSNTGNTAGNTATQFGTWVLAASTNVTVSGSTGAAGVHTAWLSVADPGAGAAMSVGMSTQGNTAGNTGYNTRQALLVGANCITLSQATTTGGSGTLSIVGPASGTTANAVFPGTLAGAIRAGGVGSMFANVDHQHEGVQYVGMSTAGNTAGTTGVEIGNVFLHATNALTLSRSWSSLTVPGLSLANISYTFVGPASGTTVSDVTTGGVTGTRGSRFAMEDHQHRGVRGVAASGTASTFFGDVVLSGGNNITLSTGGASTAGSIAIHGRAGPDVQYWANIGPGSTTTHLNDAQLHLSPMWVGFPGYITVSGADAAVTAFFSGVSNASMSASHTLSMQFGIYQLSNSTALSALATCSTVFSTGVATVANSNSYHGVRMVSLPGSVWGGTASSFALTPGNYWWGVWIRSSGSSHVATGIKMLGGAPVGNNFSVFSGMMGQSTNTTRAMAPFWGVVRYTNSTTQASLQTSVALTQMQNATTTDRMMYQYIAIGGTGLGTF